MKRSVQKFFLWCVIVGALSWTVYLLSVPARSSRAYEIREDWIVEYHDSVFTEMQVDRRIVDLGDVPPDSMIYADYVIRNTGENPLSIHKVDPDCSCTDLRSTGPKRSREAGFISGYKSIRTIRSVKMC